MSGSFGGVSRPPSATDEDIDPLRSTFAPWQFMLAVDEVNYSIDELVRLARRADGLEPVNLASGVNFMPAPPRLISFALSSATDPLFWHDYDGPFGHVVGRAAVAVCETLRGDGALRLGVDNVIITAGASAAMGLVARGLRGVGKASALIPVPTFPLAGAVLAAAGFRIIQVPTSQVGIWLPSVEELIEAASGDTRVVYVNTFNNPSGEHYGADSLRRLVLWAQQRGVVILHDTVSSGVASGQPMPHLLSIAAAEGYSFGVVEVGSISKTRAMPGFRVGWIIADPGHIRALGHSNELGAPSSPSIASPALLVDLLATALADASLDGSGNQALVAGAYRRFRAIVQPYADAYDRLDDFLDSAHDELVRTGSADEVISWQSTLRQTLADNVAVLSDQYGDLVEDIPPWRGDFNTLVRVPALAGHDYLATTHRLFREHRLQTLPAPAFGLDSGWWAARGYYTRLSFALPTQVWVKGLDRLRRALREISGS